MPHIVVEHSFPIEESKLKGLLLDLNQNVSKEEGGFDINQCKSRSVFCPHFVVADGLSDADFIHITIRIMSGRSQEIRKKLAQNILQNTQNFICKNNLAKNQIKLSLDISEMDKEIYQKTIIDKK
jgi:5-carboxymethyl-2-hydroxymuconate isomerase